jgi:hypothetical protein
MNKLERLQEYANKCASKLGITDRVILRWSEEPCKCKPRHDAHCHTQDGKMPRGTICIKRGNSHLIAGVHFAHKLIAHEVSHLATKCSHSSYTFAARMETLGMAGAYEKSYLKSRRQHHHVYSYSKMIDGTWHHYCHFCYKEKP